MTYDTVLIDGTDLGNFARNITLSPSLLAPAEMRGDDFLVNGVPGETYQPKVAPARTVAVSFEMTGQDPTTGVWPTDTLAGFNDNLRTLKKLVWKESATIALTRRQSFSTGNEDHVGTATYLRGLEPDLQWWNYGKFVLEFKLLSGVWYATSDTTVNPGTVTIGGECRTRRAVLTLPGAGTLANTTSGSSVTVTAATTLDVLAGTSSAGLDKVTAWSGPWFEAVAGSNTITWSGTGTPSVAVRPAYL